MRQCANVLIHLANTLMDKCTNDFNVAIMAITVTLLHPSHYTNTDLEKKIKRDSDEDEGHEIGRSDSCRYYHNAKPRSNSTINSCK